MKKSLRNHHRTTPNYQSRHSPYIMFSIDSKKLTEFAIIAGTAVSCYYLMTMPSPDAIGANFDKKAQAKSDHNVKRILEDNPDLANNLKNLNTYEKKILADVFIPNSKSTRFKDIAGIDDILEDLYENVIIPLQEFGVDKKQLNKELKERFGHLVENGLLEAPKGVLLYGPPGTGKSLTAKAVATECNAAFINISISTLLSSYYGESSKLVKALFTVADRIKPCVIFIDEIDSVFKTRSDTDHEVTSKMKSEFLSLIDGLETDGGILMMGATNRRTDIDEAFLRRMPKQYKIGLPDKEAREKILSLYIQNIPLDNGLSIKLIAENTSGFSGSDLKEICRNAINNMVKEYRKLPSSKHKDIRPLTAEDFGLTDMPFFLD